MIDYNLLQRAVGACSCPPASMVGSSCPGTAWLSWAGGGRQCLLSEPPELPRGRVLGMLLASAEQDGDNVEYRCQQRCPALL